jgi:putative drug exporter of the RND superfamily
VRSGLLGRIAGAVSRHPRLVIGAWIFVVAALVFVGRNLEHELSIHTVLVEGSPSERAHEIAVREFGSDSAMVVMLRGPQQAVERQGRRLAERLSAKPQILVVSPWARGAAVEGLRPKPGVAALIVRVETGPDGEVIDTLPPVEKQIDASVRGPVRASIAGFPVVASAIRTTGQESAKAGELIAGPVLLIVLLLVFRSVIAALLPLIVGGAVVFASRGVLSLLTGVAEIDLFALAVVGMMGLALGVDYSLLVVSRFREREPGGDVVAAAQETGEATARSVLPAGCGLIAAMVVSSLLLPGVAVRSVAIAVVVATVLSMISALCVTPALLAMLGDNLERWSLPRRKRTGRGLLRWSRRIASRPRAVVAIVLGLVLLSSLAFNLESGATNLALLPSGNADRQQLEEVEDALGPGWASPMEVIMNGRGQPITSAGRLRALAAFQRRVEADPGVESMAGFARIERGARQLRGVEATLVAQERGLDRLQTGVAKVHRGAAFNGRGLHAAARGSSGLTSGLGAANEGAGALAEGLQATSSGSQQLSEGLDRTSEGSGQLAQGATKASGGAGQLAGGIERASEQTDSLVGSARLFRNASRSGNERLGALHAPLDETEAQLATALASLRRMTAGKADPEYAATVRAVEQATLRLTGTDPASGEQSDPAYDGVPAGVEAAEGQFDVDLYLAAQLDRNGRRATQGMERLAKASARLDQGLQRLAAASRQISGGIGALDRGGEQLSPALRQLSQGADRLAGGLGLLENGSTRLSEGLGTGAQKSGLLTGALDRIGSGLARQRGAEDGGSQLDQLQQDSPGLFKSGYFVLASLDGSPPQQRDQLGFLVNIDRGGNNARMLVVPRDEPNSPAAAETLERLEDEAAELADQTGAEVVVGGSGPNQIVVNDEIRERAPLMRLALSLVSLLILIPVMRSLTIPVIAAALNALTVSASLGALALLFNGSLLGGPGYVDATVVPATMMVMFGLAIDYEVFVVVRMREEYLRTGSPATAVRNGLDRTAHVITGAAIIMVSVFLAFSVSESILLRNFGVAQAIAVLIDAFIVRLIVIPAVMSWLGKWSWWMPRWPRRRSARFPAPQA